MKNYPKHLRNLNELKALKRLLKLTASATLLFGSCVAVAQPCTPWSDDFYQQSDLVVGTVEVIAGDIFELSKPEESKAIHRAANKLHIKTKQRVIERQLLFTEGEPFKKRILDETTRLIRAHRYIKDVTITPVEICGGKVNIKVKTNDKWTLSPGASFGKSGGNSKSGFEIQENNLLGLGKSLSLNYKSTSERREKLIKYSDEQFLGTRKHLNAAITNNSDGNGYQLDLSLPYYSLDSRRAWGTNNSSIQQDNSIYTKGEVTDTIQYKEKAHSVFWGWSNGYNDDVATKPKSNLNNSKKYNSEINNVSRFKVGWNYSEAEFGELSPLTQSYPWFEYENIQEQFTTRTNFQTMGEIEDVPLGLRYSIGIGILNKELGSSENHVRLASKISKGFEFKNSLGFIHSDAVTYLGDGRLEGEVLDLKGELFTFNSHGSDMYFSSKLRIKNNLQQGEQLLLGSETGLRGYPEGYQDGTKSLVMTAEKRFHFDWYPLQLAKFGAVVFADAGTTWGGKQKAEILSDVGFGIRMIPTRTSNTKALHLDFAFPLNTDDNIDDFQITLKTKQSF